MTAVGMFMDSEMFEVLLVPVPEDLSGIIYFKIFLLLMMFVNAYIAMFSLSFFTAICYGLYKVRNCRANSSSISQQLLITYM